MSCPHKFRCGSQWWARFWRNIYTEEDWLKMSKRGTSTYIKSKVSLNIMKRRTSYYANFTISKQDKSNEYLSTCGVFPSNIVREGISKVWNMVLLTVAHIS